MSTSQKYDYLILGNSAAAISAIETIRLCNKTGTIAVVSPEKVPAYSTPMISYLLKGKTSLEKMSIRSDDFMQITALIKSWVNPQAKLTHQRIQ